MASTDGENAFEMQSDKQAENDIDIVKLWGGIGILLGFAGAILFMVAL